MQFNMNDAMNGDICDVCDAVESNVHFEMHRRTSASNSTCVLYYRHNASHIYVIVINAIVCYISVWCNALDKQGNAFDRTNCAF